MSSGRVLWTRRARRTWYSWDPGEEGSGKGCNDFVHHRPAHRLPLPPPERGGRAQPRGTQSRTSLPRPAPSAPATRGRSTLHARLEEWVTLGFPGRSRPFSRDPHRPSVPARACSLRSALTDISVLTSEYEETRKRLGN